VSRIVQRLRHSGSLRIIAHMRSRVGRATRCAAKAAVGLLLLAAAAACTEMGPEPPATSSPPVAASPRFRTPVPRPTLPPAVAATDAPADMRPPTAAPEIAADDQPERGIHRVRAGETVYGIARRYDVDAYALVNANRLSPPFDLVEGRRLVIPGAAPGGGTLSPPASATASTPPVEARRPVPRPEDAAPTAEPEERTAALPEPPAGEGGFAWPVEGRIISDFGAKGGGRFNDGINIAAASGSPVRASQAGVVAYAGNELRGFGNMLLIKHSGGWVTAYAHNQELLVRRGEKVRRGQVIARAGATGGVDQPQLHFEIRKGKVAVDPLQQLRRPSATAAGGRAAG